MVACCPVSAITHLRPASRSKLRPASCDLMAIPNQPQSFPAWRLYSRLAIQTTCSFRESPLPTPIRKNSSPFDAAGEA